jgi:hypothetical protein
VFAEGCPQEESLRQGGKRLLIVLSDAGAPLA